MPRIMKIIHFLEASGFILIESSPPTRNSSLQSNLNQLTAIPEQKDNEYEADNNNNNIIPFIEHNQFIQSAPELHRVSDSSVGSVGSDSLSENDRDLLSSSSFLRVIVGQMAEQLLFSDDEFQYQDTNNNNNNNNNNDDDDDLL